MILENQPSVVSTRRRAWALYDSSERIPMVHGQELLLRKDCSYSETLFCFRRTHLIELAALSRFELDARGSEPVVCFDVGANIGYVSAYLAQRSDVAKVFSLEPDPKSFAVLERNSEYYSKIVPLEKGAGSSPDAVQSFWLGASNSAHNMSTAAGQDKPHPGDAIDSLLDSPIEVQFTSIDAVSTDSNVGLIKIDVQGGEPSVLRGAWLTIERNLPLLWIEFTPEEVDLPRQELIDEVARVANNLDYRIYTADRFGFLQELTLGALQSFVGDVFLSPGWLPHRDK